MSNMTDLLRSNSSNLGGFVVLSSKPQSSVVWLILIKVHSILRSKLRISNPMKYFGLGAYLSEQITYLVNARFARGLTRLKLGTFSPVDCGVFYFNSCTYAWYRNLGDA